MGPSPGARRDVFGAAGVAGTETVFAGGAVAVGAVVVAGAGAVVAAAVVVGATAVVSVVVVPAIGPSAGAVAAPTAKSATPTAPAISFRDGIALIMSRVSANGAVTGGLYTPPMPGQEETTDVAALFARLKEEVRAAGPRAADVPPAQVRLSVRDQAERLWPISAERPIVGKGGPVKAVLRRLMRWYVEPAFADQRAFNDAVLKLVDDLDERLRRLEQQQRA
jgi:hypothetical protein